MKEQLQSLKESAIQIVTEKETLKKQKEFFNMKVEEQKNTLGIEEVFNYNEDSYEAASLLLFECADMVELISKVKKEHPKYGNKRIKELVLTALEALGYDIAFMEKVIDNYFLYEACGFYKVQTVEQSIEVLEEEAKVTTGAILDETKEAAKKVGTSIANVAKPYGEVAKSQIGEAKTAAKGLLNKGSKKLMKILEDVETKTR